MPGEVTLMHRDPVRRSLRGPRAPVLAAALLTLAAGFALAQSTIQATSFATRSTTVWQFLLDNSSRRPPSNCSNATTRPEDNFTCLVAVLKATGLDQTLKSDGSITLFAPTDAGFSQLEHLLGSAGYNRLMRDTKKLTTVLNGLMVKGRYTSADLKGRAVPATGRLSLPTLAGSDLRLTFDRFPTAGGRVKVAVGSDTGFNPAWTPYLSGETTLVNNGAIIPMDMLYLPASLR